MHRRIVIGLALLLIGSVYAVLPVAAEPRCFPETTQCIDGRIRQYWEQNGALPVFGFPITGAENELNRDTNQTFLTQWFERNRFEIHPENQAPYDVLLGRLGDDRLRQQGRDWQTFPKADPNAPRYFSITGHAIANEPFWQYWRSHGLDLGDPGISERESLALFGMPISEPTLETNASGDTVLTQWFERARFEYHPNQPDPYKVLLGLLGNEIRANAGAAPSPGASPSPSGSPSPSASPSPSRSPNPAPNPLPPSYNNCQEDPYKDAAPEFPVKIMRIDKSAEVVTIKNVSDATVNLDGWRICSIKGNQLHATLNGTLAPGAEQEVRSQAGGNIWRNDDDDDGALYNNNGSLVSYWDD